MALIKANLSKSFPANSSGNFNFLSYERLTAWIIVEICIEVINSHSQCSDFFSIINGNKWYFFFSPFSPIFHHFDFLLQLSTILNVLSLPPLISQEMFERALKMPVMAFKISVCQCCKSALLLLSIYARFQPSQILQPNWQNSSLLAASLDIKKEKIDISVFIFLGLIWFHEEMNNKISSHIYIKGM